MRETREPPLLAHRLATRPFYDAGKSIMDLCISVLALVLLAPVWVLIAVLVKLTSDGPVFFTAEAIGKNEVPYCVYKFRTMFVDSNQKVHEEFLDKYVNNNEPFAIVRDRMGREKKVYKVINDSRVTPLGRVLRRTGLDEVPQFLNVLKGEMSIVGPRAPMKSEFVHYNVWHKQRLAVLPGITGLYQVTKRSEVPFDEMVKIDLEYISTRSMLLDIIIMLKTLPVMLFSKGAY